VGTSRRRLASARGPIPDGDLLAIVSARSAGSARYAVSGKFVDRRPCIAALGFHSGQQLGGEVVESLVAGEHEHVHAGDCAASARVAIKVDNGEVALDANWPQLVNLAIRQNPSLAHSLRRLHGGKDGPTCKPGSQHGLSARQTSAHAC
jgi:hypothetical protein